MVPKNRQAYLDAAKMRKKNLEEKKRKKEERLSKLRGWFTFSVFFVHFQFRNKKTTKVNKNSM